MVFEDLFEARSLTILYFTSEWVIRLVMLFVAPMKRNPEAAKGWLLLIFFFPWVGLLIYLMIGRPTLPQWRIDELKRLPEVFGSVIQRLQAHPNIFHPDLGPELGMAVKLAANLGHLPILGGNDSEIIVDYDSVFVRLAADIDAAEQHVHLLFYIYADDDSTAIVTEALARATRRGVKCRVLIDAVGSRHWLPGLIPKLEAAGVEVHKALDVGFLGRLGINTSKATGRYDLRNHRKIAVIDGRIGYSGSQNLVAADFKPGMVFEELLVRVSGPIVLELQYIFVVDWYLETDETLKSDAEFPEPRLTGSLPMQVLPSGPAFPTQTTQRLIVALVHAATERVVITTPYLIPDDSLCQAMETAVRRGVEVHLVVSAQKDQWIVGLAQESYYDQLLESGIKIHRYHKRFLHAKHLSVDNRIALVGSSNMDARSFLLNAEVSVLAYDQAFTARLRAEQERYFADSDVLVLADWQSRGQLPRFFQNMARLMSPLL